MIVWKMQGVAVASLQVKAAKTACFGKFSQFCQLENQQLTWIQRFKGDRIPLPPPNPSAFRSVPARLFELTAEPLPFPPQFRDFALQSFDPSL